MAMWRSPWTRDGVSSPGYKDAAGKSQAEGTSIALIFVDAKQAFYAVIRKLALQVVEHEHAMLSLFEQLRIPPDAVEKLSDILATGPAMQESSLSDTAIRDIASTYTASHFQVRGSEDIRSANKGTRPGLPYADVVFSFAFHQVLHVRSLAQDLDSDDLRPSVPTAIFSDGEIHQGEDVKLPMNAFFDDFVLVATAPTPQELIPKCARVLQKAGKHLQQKAWKSMTTEARRRLSYNLMGQVQPKLNMTCQHAVSKFT